MALPIVHPIAIDSLAVLLVAPLTENLTVDEQAVVGAFLTVLGDLLALNSTYLSTIQSTQVDNYQDDQDQYELIQQSIDKIKEELEKIKKEKMKC